MALRETESAYRRRTGNEWLVREASRILMPAAIVRRQTERERIAREVTKDQHGYVWWHHWERRGK
jgi:hypothetical protein